MMGMMRPAGRGEGRMTATEQDVLEAERLARFRAWIFLVEALLFVGMQIIFFDSPAAERARLLNNSRVLAWIFWVVLLLAMMSIQGGLRSNKAVRALLNDELTRMNRARAYAAGFWAAMAGALGLTIVQMWIEVTGREAVHIIVSAALGAALLTFALLDWRGRSSG
ncbi:MAG: hypothetical protein JWO81_1707 [Alphaproteobacteria bacterium]|nr:hypothetical protein [Alphaproteobacteria bacterium]